MKKNYRGIFFIAANWINAKIQFGNSQKTSLRCQIYIFLVKTTAMMKSNKGQSSFFKTNVRQALSEKKALREHPQLTPDSFLAFFFLI